jgi:multidrug efflux pump subunit AcrA (membrane-fusion protein)
MPVQVHIVQATRIAETTEYLSVLKSRQSAVINPQVEGQVTAIFVKSGEQVSAGTPLLQIDPLKQQATVSSQEAARRNCSPQGSSASKTWTTRNPRMTPRQRN